MRRRWRTRESICSATRRSSSRTRCRGSSSTRRSATVQQLEATLKSDQAQIDSARLNLTYARITSPLTGRIGLRLVDPGQHRSHERSERPGGHHRASTDRRRLHHSPGQLPDVQQQLAAGQRLAVDAYDRDLRTQARVRNALSPLTARSIRRPARSSSRPRSPTRTMRSFRISSSTPACKSNDPEHAVIVPAAAIQRGPQRTFVYVVGAGQHRRVARRHGDDDRRRRAVSRRQRSPPEKSSSRMASIGCSLAQVSAVRFADAAPRGGSP